MSFLEDKDNWHGKALSSEQANHALAELGWTGDEATAIVVEPKPASQARSSFQEIRRRANSTRGIASARK